MRGNQEKQKTNQKQVLLVSEYEDIYAIQKYLIFNIRHMAAKNLLVEFNESFFHV